MSRRPRITLKLVERKGPCGCHRGHRVGECFDFDTERGQLCPMALHVAFPYIDILRYGGTPPTARDGKIKFSCPDVDTLNIFEITVENDGD
ncbi:MAG TPA: TIGR04076 family protein [Candidatus Avisuccinivibrio pullicola]|nr:TIGR04076 family protein [Candidatus Avisuccinivibrio pullicola]